MFTEDKDLLKILKQACKKAGSQRKWAMQNKVSITHVNDTLQGNRKLGKKIAKALGYKKATIWTLTKPE